MGDDYPTGASQNAAGTEALLAQRLVSLADTLVDDYDVIDLLDRLVHTCLELLPVQQAGLMLHTPAKELRLVASSHQDVRRLEQLQLEHPEGGPSVECAMAGEPAGIDDVTEETGRWATFAKASAEAGYQSVYAVPMRLREEVIGALTLFGSGGTPLTANERRLAKALADVATIGILQQRSLHRASLLAEQLQTALNSRIVIEQAKGVLAEHGGVDMDTALRSFSRNSNLKLSAVAQSLAARERDPDEVLRALRRPPS
jgi:GAF domain-containing protein